MMHTLENLEKVTASRKEKIRKLWCTTGQRAQLQGVIIHENLQQTTRNGKGGSLCSLALEELPSNSGVDDVEVGAEDDDGVQGVEERLGRTRRLRSGYMLGDSSVSDGSTFNPMRCENT